MADNTTVHSSYDRLEVRGLAGIRVLLQDASLQSIG